MQDSEIQLDIKSFRWQPNQTAEVTVWKLIRSFKMYNAFSSLHLTARGFCFQQLCFDCFCCCAIKLWKKTWPLCL